jgi:hypothetical protein
MARNYMMYRVISCLRYVTKWVTLLRNARRFGRLIEQLTYSRVEVRKEEIFPSSHMTTSISDESVRGCDLSALDLMATSIVPRAELYF